MSSSNLDELKKRGEQVLLAEMLALLHDVGKLSSQFVDKMSSSPAPSARDFEHERAIERVPGFVDSQFLSVLKSRKLRDFLRLKGVASREHIGQAVDLIFYHDRGRHSAFLVRLLNRCDGIDSGADKGTTRDKDLPQQAKQARNQTFISTAFGLEPTSRRLDLVKLDNSRVKLTSKIGQELQKLITGAKLDYRHILEIVYGHFQDGLGETRRSANDVSLWDHSFSVATLYKSAIAQLLYIGSLNEDALRWRLLRVNFDVLGLYAKAIRIADLLGYQEAVRRACEEVKHLVEEEYPLGNEVYRDTTGIYFIFPDIDLPAELAEEIRRRVEEIELELAPRITVGMGTGSTVGEQLRTILAKQWKEARQELTFPFDKQANLSPRWQQLWENLPPGQWEICPVCRLRPKSEKREICEHCEQRRTSRVETWLREPTKTIWLDEIADHHGRVALIVAKFGLEGWLSGDLVKTMLVRAVENNSDECKPKNPSPARLRRVWVTCQGFWTDTVEKGILAQYPYGQRGPAALRSIRLFLIPDAQTGWRENVPYDGTIAGQPISLLWDAKEKRFLTIINLQLTAGESKTPQDPAGDWRDREIEVGDPDNPRRRLAFKVVRASPATGDFAHYRPYLPLLTSPDQFLALVPADDALEIAGKIRQAYIEQMGKVQNRLPLFLGLVFFPRKMPLMAVMDTARRMLESVVFEEESWQVECVEPTDRDLKYCVRLSQDARRLEYRVPVKMGDETTDDNWYPYFAVEGDPGPRCLRFRHNGRWLVHVRDLREGDRVRVYPSQFSYVFLEHTAQRFAFHPERDVVLLDDLPKLMEMWRDICRTSEMTDTKLQGIWRLFDTKWEHWKLDSDREGRKAFEELVRTTFAREGITRVTVEDVLTRRFQRCLELHLRILKRKVKEE